MASLVADYDDSPANEAPAAPEAGHAESNEVVGNVDALHLARPLRKLYAVGTPVCWAGASSTWVALSTCQHATPGSLKLLV